MASARWGDISAVGTDSKRLLLQRVPLKAAKGVEILKSRLFEKYGIPPHCSILFRSDGAALTEENMGSLEDLGVHDGDILVLRNNDTDSSCSSANHMLAWAAASGHEEAVRYLIEEEGADPSRRCYIYPHVGLITNNPRMTENMISVMPRGEFQPPVSVYAKDNVFEQLIKNKSPSMVALWGMTPFLRAPYDFEWYMSAPWVAMNRKCWIS